MSILRSVEASGHSMLGMHTIRRHQRRKLVGDIQQLQEDLEDLTNVDDVEEDVSTTGELFSISSFGVDYPVETLVSRMEKKLFYIPPFQRAFVWSQNQCSRFIESLLLGLPVPGIFLFKEADSGKHLVIDGQQRLKSLLYFSEGVINGKEFALSGLETKFANRTSRRSTRQTERASMMQ